MKVLVNNTEQETSNKQSIQGLLDELAINAQKGAAVAINNVVIRKTEWPNYQLNANDKITIIKATQGG